MAHTTGRRSGFRGYVDTAEGQIHYRQVGDGPVVILCHQAAASSAMWTALLPELAALGHRAVAFDMPGCGMSDPPVGQPDLEYYARRIEEAAEALGITGYDVVGHHTGCSVAIWLAARRPCRVRRIVAYGVPLMSPEAKRHMADEPPPVHDADAAVALQWWKGFTTHVPADQAQELVPRYVADVLLAGSMLAYPHRAVGRADHAAALRSLAVPMLAVAGRREMLYEETKACAPLSRLIEFVEMGDAGILVADERPVEFARLIDDFLRRP
jgi:pimeloyl-ACP methyl ester carboxylesterase